MPLGIGSPDAPKEPSLIEMRTDFLNAATGFANAKVQMDITELLALGDQDLPPRGQKRLLLDDQKRADEVAGKAQHALDDLAERAQKAHDDFLDIEDACDSMVAGGEPVHPKFAKLLTQEGQNVHTTTLEEGDL